MSNDLINMIADEMIGYIESSADRARGLRYNYLDSMSAQQWRNRDFDELLNIYVDALDNTMDEVDPHQRMSESQVVRKTVPKFIDGHFATIILGSRAADQLDDRDYHEMLDASNDWKDRWMGNTRNRARGNSRSRQVNSHYSTRDKRDTRDRPGDRSRSTVRHRSNNSNTFSRDELASGIGSGNRPIRNNPTSKVASGMWGAVTQMQRQSIPEEHIREREVVRPTPMQPTTPPPPPKPSLPEGLDYTKERPHESYCLKGEHWFHTNVVTPELDKRYGKHPTFYNVNTHLRYLVVGVRNEVREEFIPVTEDNRYLQQELLNNPSSQRRVSNQISLRNPKVPTDTKITTPEVKNKPQLAEIISSIDTTPPTDSKVLLSGSMGESVETMLLELSANTEEEGIFKTHIVRDLVILMSDDPHKDAFLEELDVSINLVQFHGILYKYKALVDANLWAKVNQRMSLALQASMRYQWLLPGSKPMNFYNDYLLMLDKMKERFANNPEFMSKYVKRTAALIQQVTTRILPDEVGDFIGDLLPANVKATDVKVVLFTNSEYLFIIRRSADELGIGKQLDGKLTGVAVRQLEGLDLQNAIREVYRNLPFVNTAARTVQPLRLITHDTQIIEIYPYECRSDEFILTNVKK